MAEKYWQKKCLSSLAIEIWQIKITLRFHFSPVRMAKINKTSARPKEGQVKGKPHLLCWDCKLVQPLKKSVWRILQMLKLELPYDTGIPLLGTHPNGLTSYSTESPSAMFIPALLTVSRKWK